MARLLLIEDHAGEAAHLVVLLGDHGHAVDVAGTMAAGAEKWRTGGHDAVLLDWTLPDGEGIDLLRLARGGGVNTPVLMVSGRWSEDDKCVALDAGADDYVSKPYRLDILVARIAAVLRRSGGRRARTLRWDEIVVNLDARVVTVAGRRIEVSPLERRLLEALLRTEGEVVTREELERRLWGSAAVSPGALHVQVAHLRAKLGAAGRLIETSRGEGYRMRRDDGGDDGARG